MSSHSHEHRSSLTHSSYDAISRIDDLTSEPALGPASTSIHFIPSCKVLIVLPPHFWLDVPDVEKVNSQTFPIVLCVLRPGLKPKVNILMFSLRGIKFLPRQFMIPEQIHLSSFFFVELLKKPDQFLSKTQAYIFLCTRITK